MREISVFGGSAHPELTSQICAKLGVPQQPVVTRRFANDCLEVQLQSNCRERDVFLIQPLSPPVQDHLVARVHHWPGVNGFAALLGRRCLHARRPWHFFRAGGSMPEDVEMQLTIPPELGPEAEVLAELRDRVRTVEAEYEAERLRTGRRVCGRRGVLAQSWREHPATFEPRRNLRPRVATRCKWARVEALSRDRAFVAAYMAAREQWRAGIPVQFPVGTYWLQRFAHVPVEAA